MQHEHPWLAMNPDPDEQCVSFADIVREYDAGSSTTALVLCDARLASQPDHGPTWKKRGVLLTELGRYEDAWRSFEAALEQCPDHARGGVFAQFGHLEQCRGRLAEARRWFRKALTFDPGDCDWQRFIGLTYLADGRLEEAERALRGAADAADDTRADVFADLGDVLRARERLTEARDVYRDAHERDPSHVKSEAGLRDVEGALAGPEAHAFDAEGWQHLHELEEDDQLARALRFSRAWLEERPGPGPVLVQQGVILTRLHRYAEARGRLESARDGWRGRAGLFDIYLGHVEKERGLHAEAREHYMRAHALCPGDAGALIWAALAYSREGDLPSAEEHLRRATRCTDGAIDEAWCNLGGVLLGLERYAEARECYLETLAIDPQDEMALERLDDLERAMELSRRLA